MKFTKATYRFHNFSAINKLNKDSEDFIGEAIVTKDTKMSTGYFERGSFPRECLIKAGTPVRFELKQLNDGSIYCSLGITTNHKFEDGRTLEVKAYHRMDCSFEEAMKKLRLNRNMK